MVRVLCISPYFPPRADSESFCGGKFVLELLKAGMEFTVLCRDPTTPYPKACDDSTFWAPLKEISINLPTPARKERLRSARLSLGLLARNYARWIGAILDEAERLHRMNPYDIVYSRSLPMEAHIAGYWTSRRLKLPWIANINDPWDWHLMPKEMRIKNSFLNQSISSFWMRKTLKKADLVTYPSARLRDYHLHLSGVKHESAIIPHVGYTREKKERDDPFFSMVHAGKLGGLETRSPMALLQGIAQFLKRHPEARNILRVVFVGKEEPSTRFKSDELGLQSIVKHTGMVSYEKSLEFISAAAVCVLVEGNLSEGIFLPSKLADYLVAGKPVLALSPSTGVVADLAAWKGVVRVDIEGEEGAEAAIAAYYHAFQSGRIEEMSPPEELKRSFRPSTVAELFRAKVEEIMEKKGTLFHLDKRGGSYRINSFEKSGRSAVW